MEHEPTYPVDEFFRRIEELEHWPEGVVPVPERIDPPAFFAASDGLWRDGPDDTEVEFPFGGVMVVGHNLDSEEKYRERLEDKRPHGGEESQMATWRNLLATLERAGLSPRDCFFTNAYVGLKAGSNPSGQFPGEHDPAFRAWCEDFLVEQVQVMAPQAVVALGKPARQFLARLSDDLGSWRASRQSDVDEANAGRVPGVSMGGTTLNAACLVHPSFGRRHVGSRVYRDPDGILHEGGDAEAALLRDVIRH